jgi:hypothetical protein
MQDGGSRSETAVSLQQKLKDEIRAVAITTLYFAMWLGSLVLLKKIILAEYQIEFHGLSVALIGALILAKVVLVLEHVSLGTWVRNHSALIEVVLRTALYAFGVFVVLVLERTFEGRHEFGGFGSSLMAVFREAKNHHVWANTICLSSALLGYNILSVVRRHLGEGGLIRLFLSPLPEERGPKHVGSPAPNREGKGDRS